MALQMIADKRGVWALLLAAMLAGGCGQAGNHAERPDETATSAPPSAAEGEAETALGPEDLPAEGPTITLPDRPEATDQAWPSLLEQAKEEPPEADASAEPVEEREASETAAPEESQVGLNGADAVAPGTYPQIAPLPEPGGATAPDVPEGLSMTERRRLLGRQAIEAERVENFMVDPRSSSASAPSGASSPTAEPEESAGLRYSAPQRVNTMIAPPNIPPRTTNGSASGGGPAPLLGPNETRGPLAAEAPGDLSPEAAPQWPAAEEAAEAPRAEPALPQPEAREAAVPGPDEAASAQAAQREPPPAELAAETAAEKADAQTAENEEEFTRVEVFYGTDRAALGPAGAKDSASGQWLMAGACCVGLGLVLGAVGFRFYRRRSVQVAALTLLVFGGGVLLISGYALWQDLTLESIAAADRIDFGNERGALTLGTCEVAIPKSHTIGKLEAPSLLRLELREDPTRHVMLVDVEQLDEQKFFDSVRQRVEGSENRNAFVFIHGYNVTFEDAARRTAQMAYDLKFDGAPLFYSWPSQGGLFKYTIDENNVRWTVPHLKQFLTAVSERTGAEHIHLIAHSMGNRALTDALRDFALQAGGGPTFDEVILTAPDIDADTFRRDIAPAIVRTADRVTLYASSNDRALASSKQVHGYPRAGESGDHLVVVPGVDTVDVSAVDTSLFGLGHSYYGDNDTVLADLFDLIQQSKPPEQRKWLRPEAYEAMRYWVFQRM